MFSVVTDFLTTPVTTEVSLSPQSLPVWCRDKAGLAGRCCDRAPSARDNASVRMTERALCAHCAHDRPCDNAQCCALFGSLFMDTAKKNKKKT